MSPRPYRLGQRKEASEQTRARIVAAAREVVMAGGRAGGFSIDAVAQQAGVARMTVYYQFGSRAGLLEALFDDLAERGLVERLPAVFSQKDPLASLAELIAAFTHFWGSDRLVLRRVRALAALDPAIETAVRARDERRREHLRNILRRLPDENRAPNQKLDDAVDLLHTLTSFETFDALAIEGRDVGGVTAILQRLAYAVLGLDEMPSAGS